MGGRSSSRAQRPWRTFAVTIDGRHKIVAAATRGAALYSAWLDFSDAWGISFAWFIRRARAIPCPTPDDGYAYVRRAYGIDVRPGDRITLCNEGPDLNDRQGTVVYPGCSTAHVHVVMDGERHASRVHPFSLTPARRAA